MEMAMELRQREHVHAVMTLAGEGASLPGALLPDALIRESWLRCVHTHRLDPTRMQQAVILPQQQWREHRERIDEFLHIARHGLEALYQQVAGMGYCVLLTDARGITVDFIGDLQLDPALRRAGLYLGADWSEHHTGTCGVGTAIATGQALTVHQGDHFDATHIPLTCTAAPVYDPLGRLNAILDISALTSPQAKSSQHLALQLVKVYANRVENANFLRWFRNDWVLKLHPSPEFVEIAPDLLVALDAAGRIVGHNRPAQLLLQAEAGTTVLGLPLQQLFRLRIEDLGHYVRAMPGNRRAVMLAGSGRTLFLHAVPPPVAPQRAPVQPVADAGIPAPLARLTGGDPALTRQIQRAARLVDTPVSILISGETGSGKEYFAKALHEASQRRDKPFRRHQLRGHSRHADRKRALRPPAGQLLGRARQGQARPDPGRRRRHPVPRRDRRHAGSSAAPAAACAVRARAAAGGRHAPVAVDIRVIAATHHDLEARVREGRFRDDLYYRLAGAQLRLPPLRERADLAWLLHRMLREGGAELTLSSEAEARLRQHSWPGNLRELRNVIEFARAVCDGAVIQLADLPDALAAGRPATAAAAGVDAGADAAHRPEARLLLQYLRAAGWNVSAVAHQMGVSRMTLYRRMKRWDIHSPNRSPALS
jgi:transcriptional regulator of acetoin/glycerol metabolism